MVFEGLFATPSPLLPGGQVKFLGNVFEGIQTADTEVLWEMIFLSVVGAIETDI